MPLSFACPHCGAQTLVDEQFLGQTGPCYGCGKQVTIPTNETRPRRANRPNTSFVPIAMISIGAVIVAGILIALLVLLVMPSLPAVRLRGVNAQCQANLQTIGLALQQYHQAFGSYPPPYLADASGVPQHSWRVLILPYLGRSDLYQRYRFDEPWNGPNNQQLAIEMPTVYGCPLDNTATTTGKTCYYALTGIGTAFPDGNRSVKQNQLADGTMYTLLVAEGKPDFYWHEPNDFDATTMQFSINSDLSGELNGPHGDGVNGLFADGKARFLSRKTPGQYLRQMTTIAGGETIPGHVLPK